MLNFEAFTHLMGSTGLRIQGVGIGAAGDGGDCETGNGAKAEVNVDK